MRLCRQALILLVLLLVLVLLPATAWAQTSTIDTDIGDVDNALRAGHATKSFYAAGLHWFFWVDMVDDNAKFSSSADLSAGSWAAPTTLRDADYGRRLAVWYDDGTDSVHIAVVDKSDSNLYYRLGTPETDGTITWAADWDVVVAGGSYINIVTNSDGYPFVAKDATVYRSTTKNGTFTCDGSPYTFTNIPAYAELVPLTGGKVAAIATDNASGDMFLTRWDGFNWSTEKEYDDTYAIDNCPRGINIDDDVYLVIKVNTAGAVWRIAMVKYTYSTNSFGTAFWVYNNDTGSGNNPAVTKDTNDDIYILWPNYHAPASQSDIIYYRIYDVSEDAGESSLSDTVEFVDESVLDGLPAACTDINCDYNSDGYLKTFYPADVARAKVKGESLLAVSTLEAATVTETTARLRGEITMLGLASASEVGFEYRECDGATTSVSQSGAFGLGVFSHNLEGLDPDACYEYRAFATDASGTAYGEWIDFLTEADYTSPWAPGGNDTLIAVPTPPPGWTNPSPSTGAIENTIVGAILNPFFETTGFPVEFIWWLIFAIVSDVVCLASFGWGKHTFVVFVAGALVIGSMCGLQLIDWWLIFVYIVFGLSLLVNEKQITV